MKKKNIININKKGLKHGYNEIYLFNHICIKGNYKNGSDIGYSEKHGRKETIYNII